MRKKKLKKEFAYIGEEGVLIFSSKFELEAFLDDLGDISSSEFKIISGSNLKECFSDQEEHIEITHTVME